jgi:ribosomal protein L11 methyltransferase
MNSIKLTFEITSEEHAEIITALLADLNIQGSEQTENELYIYFNEADFSENDIQSRMPEGQPTYTKETIVPQNWNALWESNFDPILVNQTVGIRAHFHPPFNECEFDIVITPKMSFGTGHHETTQMMLDYMTNQTFDGKRVFDFGCGTGVLAIYAKLKGAAYTLGIDHDEWSVENSLENCSVNGCQTIEISQKPIEEVNDSFDVILANINLNILTEYMPKLQAVLENHGDIYLSGILTTDLPAMRSLLEQNGLVWISSKEMNKWAAIHAKKSNI